MSADLAAFLADHGISDAFDLLGECGIERLQDLEELDRDDLVGLGIEEASAVKILRGLGKDPDAAAARPPPPTYAPPPPQQYAESSDDDDDGGGDDEYARRAELLEGMLAVRREQSVGRLGIAPPSDARMSSCRESAYFSARESHADGDADDHEDDNSGGAQRMGVSVLPASALTGQGLRKVAIGPAADDFAEKPARPVSPGAAALLGGGAAAAAAKAYEAALLAEADKMRQEQEKIKATRPSNAIARRFGAKRAEAEEQPEPESATKFHEGEYVLIGARELGVLVKVQPDGRVKAQLSDGTQGGWVVPLKTAQAY